MVAGNLRKLCQMEVCVTPGYMCVELENHGQKTHFPFSVMRDGRLYVVIHRAIA